MDLQNEKCVMVIDEHLPLGLIANTAAIMGITLGKENAGGSRRGCFRPERQHTSCIIEFPVPILKGSPEHQGNPREAVPAGISGFDGGGFFRFGAKL